jgi:hypothetical protein
MIKPEAIQTSKEVSPNGDALEIGEILVINDPSDTEEEPVDTTDKFLANNPGNFIRQKAVNIDLSDLENVRRQLKESH